MEKERHKVFIACYLFLKNGNKILLMRRHNTGYQDGNYTMVSGHIDEGEDAIVAMKREAKEEADLDIDINDLRVVYVMQRKSPDREYIDFYLTANKWNGEPKNMEKDKCDDLGWFIIDKLPQNTVKYISKVIKDIESGLVYSAYTE